MSNPTSDIPGSGAPRGERFIAWLTGFGFVFIFSFALIASMLMLFGRSSPIGLSAFCGGVVALRWAGWHSRRSPWWLVAGIPGFLFFIGSSLVVLWRMA